VAADTAEKWRSTPFIEQTIDNILAWATSGVSIHVEVPTVHGTVYLDPYARRDCNLSGANGKYIWIWNLRRVKAGPFRISMVCERMNPTVFRLREIQEVLFKRAAARARAGRAASFSGAAIKRKVAPARFPVGFITELLVGT